MNEPELQPIQETPPPARPERWDEAVVAGYIHDLLRESV
jgi:hypothetical protein